MCYNLAYAVFGGLSPLMCTLAIHYFDSVLAPAIYVVMVALFSWTVCFMGATRDSQSTQPILEPAD
jgi:uncharacterized membrane protein